MLNGSFRVNTNKLAYQTCDMSIYSCQWWATRVDLLMTHFLSCHSQVNPFMTQTR